MEAAFIGSVISGGLGLVGSLFGGKKRRREEEAARQQALQQSRLGFDFLRNSELNQSLISGAQTASDTRNALLGLGGDEEAANQAFDNYLNSTGFDFALRTGQNAITGNRAARGLLNSGRTATALTEFGQNLGRQSFDNFLSQLNVPVQTGLQANTAIGSAGSSAGGVGAQVVNSSAGRSDAMRRDQFAGIGQGLGTIIGAFT